MKAKKSSGKKQVKRAVKSAVRKEAMTDAVDSVELVRVSLDQENFPHKHKSTKKKK